MTDETAKKASDETEVVQPADMDAYPVLADTIEGTDDEPHIGLLGLDEFEDNVRIERHHRRPDNEHVDLSQEEYTPEEVARLINTSLEVVMQAIWHDELKAERKGGDVVRIWHADVTDWLKRRAAQ